MIQKTLSGTCNIHLFGPDRKHMIIIDPGFDEPDRLVSYLKKEDCRLIAILLTHGHYDHIGALAAVKKAFPAARIYIAKKDMPLLRDPKLNLSAYLLPPPWISYDKKDVTALTSDQELLIAGITIKVLLTPFHTPGSVSYYLPEEGILYAGDSVFQGSVGRSDLPGGDPRQRKASLEKIMALPSATIIRPGHGEETTLAREEKSLAHLLSED